MSRLGGFASSALLAFFGLTANAGAIPGGDPSGGGALTGDTIVVGIIAPGQGGGGGNVSAGDPNGPPPYKYTVVPAGLVGAGIAPVCDAGFGQPGWPYSITVQDLSGAIVSQEVRCVPLNPD